MDTPDTSTVLHGIQDICSSITSITLSCRTLKSVRETVNDRQDEILLKKWMDGEKLEYKAASLRQQQLLTRKRLDNHSGETSGRSKKRIRILKEKLFYNTLSRQQAELLINRLKMSAAMLFTTFPKAAMNIQSFSDCHGGGDDESNELRQQRREKLRDRDDAVVRVLEKAKEVDCLKKNLRNLSERCRLKQEQNRDALEQQFGDGSTMTASSPLKPHKVDSVAIINEVDSLREENIQRRRTLLNAIVGSGIDWYHDEKLRNVVLKLEGSEGTS